MRVIVCDRCGAEITGDPVKIYFQMVDRITGENEQNNFVHEELDCIDLCGACADRIAEGIRKSCKPPVKSADQSCDVASPPPPRTGVNRIDAGKVMALRTAGWNVKMIAEEMRCSEATVYNVLKKKKAPEPDTQEGQSTTNSILSER